jgi:hypothetical protein
MGITSTTKKTEQVIDYNYNIIEKVQKEDPYLCDHIKPLNNEELDNLLTLLLHGGQSF